MNTSSLTAPAMEPREILARCAMFSVLDAAALDQLSVHCSLIGIRGGESLCAAGELAEAMYIVVAGQLGAHLRDDDTLLRIGRLQTVGEIGVIAGTRGNIHVYAMRDSLLLRIGRDDLLDFVQAHPAALLSISREIIHRLRSSDQQQQHQRLQQHRAYAVVPAHSGIDAVDFARQLEHALGRIERTRRIDADTVDAELGAGAAQTDEGRNDDNSRIITWLNTLEIEIAEGYLIYTASRNSDAWSRRCMRQVDRILIIAQAGELPMLTPMMDDSLRLAGNTPIDLVLLRRAGQPAGDVAAWRERLHTHTHYFVDPDSQTSFGALARQIAGRGLGLVLGSGGARGFAHLGMLRALEALEIPVDLAGGSSMGAFLAALHASGMNHREVREVARATFVEHNFLNDYHLPRVSLIRGRKMTQQLREVFGSERIENLRKPFFCISTNLTRGVASVHDSGDLALWVGTGMAVPGIVPPVVWKGELHADGAVINSLPTDVMQAMGRGPIVASDVSTEGGLAAPGIEGPDTEALLRRHELKARVTLVDILFRTATLTSESGVKARADRADCYLRMPVEGVGLFDWKRLDEIADTSYAYAMRSLEPMRDVLLCRTKAIDDAASAPDIL